MNVLRKFKYILISAFALLFTLTLASCNKDKVDANGFYKSESSVKDGFNFDKAHLSSITIDTSKAKTVFFLGEEFIMSTTGTYVSHPAKSNNIRLRESEQFG